MTFPTLRRAKYTYMYPGERRAEEALAFNGFPQLSRRVRKALWRYGMDSAAELAHTPDTLILKVRGIGPANLAEIRRVYPFIRARHPSLALADTVITDLREVGAA